LHCAPEATLQQKRFEFTPETAACNVLVAAGRQFQTPGLATAKLLSPNVLCVHGTAHDLLVEERSHCRGPSETKCMLSARYGGAWPDKDEKTKHASL